MPPTGFCGDVKAAALTVKEYVNNITSQDQSVREMTKMYVDGLGDGFVWVNALTNNAAYCQPGELALNGDNFMQMLNTEIAHFSKVTERKTLDEMMVAALLMQALKDTFPCKVK